MEALCLVNGTRTKRVVPNRIRAHRSDGVGEFTNRLVWGRHSDRTAARWRSHVVDSLVIQIDDRQAVGESLQNDIT